MTRNEHHDFWKLQVKEHLLFQSLMYTDPTLRAQAAEMHERYTGTEAQTREALAFQQAALDRLRAGEFLGFAYPLFIEHIIRETMLMLHLVWGDPLPWKILPLLTVLGAEHAEFGAHLLDPSQDTLVAEANAVADSLYADAIALQGLREPERGVASRAREFNSVRINAAETQGKLAQWLIKNGIGHGGAPSIVAPQLADHVVREQGYFDTVTREGV